MYCSQKSRSLATAKPILLQGSLYIPLVARFFLAIVTNTLREIPATSKSKAKIGATINTSLFRPEDAWIWKKTTLVFVQLRELGETFLTFKLQISPSQPSVQLHIKLASSRGLSVSQTGTHSPPFKQVSLSWKWKKFWAWVYVAVPSISYMGSKTRVIMGTNLPAISSQTSTVKIAGCVETSGSIFAEVRIVRAFVDINVTILPRPS